MATAILYQSDDGAVRVEYDYTGLCKRVSLIRCINNGVTNARVTIWRLDNGGLVDQKYYPPGKTLISTIKSGLRVLFDNKTPVFPYGFRIEYPIQG